ncbi:BlaI/MecI/CopY family transcriptional regulator [Actinokineospora xionganensis]|uniref:BlaI/MecI/CopY family transcriptional regulator n=1 Tax=Actinokineospora xionganensis TaxID=2684470 RepID=A0ABR7KZU5_9PSEU|nr:BlaI/MecI/CopY family transcriptional regulator [Actinokineospora xionganensis]MBC6445955.1 BlaI/MecI/CopY family transcriptional regulator [Actinokineospora xionganensis]
MHGLGDLESAVMDILWQADRPLKVRDALEDLNKSRNLAYTTVLTVLDNLHRKGWVRRQRAGRAFEFVPVDSREAAAARALRDLLDSTGDPDAVLLHFAESASDRESDLLRRGLRRRGGS